MGFQLGFSSTVLIFSSLLLLGCDAQLKISGGSSRSPSLTPDPVAKTWRFPSSPTDYFSPSGEEGYYSQSAMNEAGDVIMAWMGRDSSGFYQIFIAELNDGVWTRPTDIDDNISPDGESAWYPSVAMNESGDAVVTWFQDDGTNNNQIFKSERRGGVWTHPTNLADNISPDGGSAANPIVAMDNSGDTIIVWEQQPGTGYQIYKSEYRLGAWTHPINFADNISPGITASGSADVAMDNNGNAIIVWEQQDGGIYQIFKSEYRLGAWIHPVATTDNISPDGINADNAKIAMSINGTAIITWYQRDLANNFQIFISEFRAGSWTHPADRNDNISPDGSAHFNPKVAMDNSGNILIAWAGIDASMDYQIFMSEYRANTWTHPLTNANHISPAGTTVVYYPYLAMSKNGNHAIIVWDQMDPTLSRILKSQYSNGTWTHPSSVTVDAVSPAGTDAFIDWCNPVINNDGQIHFSWWQNDGIANDYIFIGEYR